MKTVLTALALTVSVIACGKKAEQQLEVAPVAETAKTEISPTSAVVDPSMGTGGEVKAETTTVVVPATSTTEVK